MMFHRDGKTLKATTAVLTAMQGDKRFGDADHAYARIADDESAPMPNRLTATVNDTGFFVDVRATGVTTAHLEAWRAGSSKGHGIATLDLAEGAETLPVAMEALFRYFTEHANLHIVIDGNGETLVVRDDPTTARERALTATSLGHAFCNSWVDRHVVSATHAAFVCRQCHLREVLPLTLKTVGDLQDHYATAAKLRDPRTWDH